MDPWGAIDHLFARLSRACYQCVRALENNLEVPVLLSDVILYTFPFTLDGLSGFSPDCHEPP